MFIRKLSMMRSVPLALLALLALLRTTVADPTVATDQYFDSAGVRIRYIERGEGEPVVLIHGFSRDIERGWIEPGVIDALAHDYRVIALDCRGHGRSEKPHESGQYGMSMVEDVVRLLDHLEIQQANVVGYSMGGRIALKLATTNADRLRTVTLIGAGGARPDRQDGPWDELASALERGEGLTPLLTFIWPADQPTPTDEQLAALNEMSMTGNDARALAAVARQYDDFATTTSELTELQLPITVIIGTVDPFRPSVDALREHAPHLRVVEFEGADHMNTLTHRQFMPALRTAVNARSSETRP